MRRQVPLQLIPASQQVGTDRFSIGLMARWKRRSLLVRTKIPMDGIRSNPVRTKLRRKAYAGMTASELNWLQSLTDFQKRCGRIQRLF